MDVVLAIFSLQGGGAEKFVLTLAEAINNAGHVAHVVCFKSIVEVPIPEGIQVHFFNYSKYRLIPRNLRAKWAARAFDKFVKTQIGNPQLVLSNLYPVDFILKESNLPNIHFVIHSTTSLEYGNKLTPKFLNQLKSTYTKRPCIAVSEGVKNDFIQLFGHQVNIQTIYNPINIEKIKQEAEKYTPDYQNYIVHVGKFKPAKRQDNLIRAYAAANIEEKLVLVGTGGMLLQQCKDLVKDLKIDHKVIFSGFQENPYPFIKNAKFMVMSSDYEGLGLVILEALALETPVISVDCPSGPNEILPPHHLVKKGDIDALSSLMQQISQNINDFHYDFKEHFTPEYAAQKYLNLVPNDSL